MATQSINVLYVEDDPRARGWVRAALAHEQSGIYLTEVASRREFEDQLTAGRYDLVLSELTAAGFEGLEVLDIVGAKLPLIPVVILTQADSTELAVAAMKKGAADYIVKTAERARELPQAIRRAVEDGLHRQTQQQAGRLRILRRIDRAILAAQSVEEIATATLEWLAQLVPYSLADVNLYNAVEDTFEIIASRPAGQSKIRLGTRLPLAQTSLNIEAFRAGQHQQVEDYLTRPNIPAQLQRMLAATETRASLAVPLIAGGKLIGTLGLGRREPGAFSAEHIEIVREVAAPLAIAIQQTQLRAAEREQRLLVETLHEVTLAITSRTELEAVFNEILDQVARIVPYKAANIALLEGDILHTVAWRGYDKFGSAAKMTHLKQPLAEFPGHIAALQKKEPRIIYDTRQDPVWVTLPETAWIRSHLLLPIVSRGEILGELRLDSDVPQDYSLDHARRLVFLAQTLAIALNNARLVNQIQQYAAELEQRVAARTAELTLTYRQQAALEERQRLARDLHDAVSQTLFSASLLAEAIPRLWTRYPEKARQSLDQLRHLNRGALAEMRILLAELRPASPEDTNLAVLLRQLAHALAGRTQIEIDLQLEGEVKIRADVQTVFYRIAQESLNNIARHARASRVKVRLVCLPEAATLTITDNGRGFDPRQVKSGHLGLDIMRERARAVGASLTLKSRPGEGTEIVVSWPANTAGGN